MKNLDELIVLDEELLESLNQAIDGTIREKQRYDIDYELLEKVLEAEIKNKRFRRRSPVEVVPIKKEELLAVTLDFFKSIDDEFYNKARALILGQLKRIRMNMYPIHNPDNDFSKKDEHGIKEYTKNGSVETKNGFSIVHIPLQEGVNAEEAKVVLASGEGTLVDLYTIVHEIAHLFDLDQENTDSITRELFGESTTMAFEELLTNYLLERKMYPKAAIIDIANSKSNTALLNANMVYAKLVLAKEKDRSGAITNEYIKEIMKQNNISVHDVRDLARRIVKDKTETMYINRYAVAGLVSPTIVKAYEDDKTKGVQTIKAYLKAVYDDNFEGALQALGIEPNEQGIATLVRTMKARDEKINEDQVR